MPGDLHAPRDVRRACRKLLKIERLEVSQGVSDVPLFWQAGEGRKRESVGLSLGSFAWSNDSTYVVRIASNHLDRTAKKGRARQPRNEF